MTEVFGFCLCADMRLFFLCVCEHFGGLLRLLFLVKPDILFLFIWNTVI